MTAATQDYNCTRGRGRAQAPMLRSPARAAATAFPGFRRVDERRKRRPATGKQRSMLVRLLLECSQKQKQQQRHVRHFSIHMITPIACLTDNASAEALHASMTAASTGSRESADFIKSRAAVLEHVLLCVESYLSRCTSQQALLSAAADLSKCSAGRVFQLRSNDGKTKGHSLSCVVIMERRRAVHSSGEVAYAGAGHREVTEEHETLEMTLHLCIYVSSSPTLNLCIYVSSSPSTCIYIYVWLAWWGKLFVL